jgi:hypothetical protein
MDGNGGRMAHDAHGAVPLETSIMREQTTMSAASNIADASTRFYRHVLETLHAARLPFLVGGAYAFSACTGISRDTKDLDLFIRREHLPAASEALRAAGYETELTFPHWLAKVRANGDMVDLIFNSGNGIAKVDDLWFRHAIPANVLGVEVGLAPVEETLWSKAFVMERERYDGADVAHLFHARAAMMDWPRLLQRFGPHWRVLLAHLVLFGFIYPGQEDAVPTWVMEDLLRRLREDKSNTAGAAGEAVCAGTLLSREQYLPDVAGGQYRDARQLPPCTMTDSDIEQWTEAIQHRDEEEHTQTRIVAGPQQ